MKKFISAALVLAMSLTMLTGCGQKAEDGAKESNADDTITVISREDGSGTRGAFIELFGIQEEENGEKVDKTTDEASITNSTSVMMSSVANDVNGIGYISLGSLNDTVKAVKIDGAEASVDNVKAGNYKIVRPFNIVLGKKANDAANDFISYIMSSEGQQIIKDNGYISIDDAAPAYAATDATGKIVVGGSSSVSPVMEKLIEAYGKVNSNVKVELQTTDSTTGVSSTVDGSYDIGMASRELKDDETAQGVEAKTIAQDGIAVVVNNENSVDELSSEQVKSIFTGETTSWSDITK
ncbi:MAG: substrate-binding domain-containing protein [Eubacterium sp.]|nr:substrate-binding domain-containing protein [Eubacterium sp.]MDD7209767.1 substrate-binding domain-containing protein [Lachnospiraceae bacterium]MDY5496788.1 substrate-binding domain-containing protein [Anaerobutyricum sp.]